jgi:glucose dehydrogenase
MAEIRTDVVVVGAGIAGALVATELARAGVKVVVLESGPRVDRGEAVRLFRESAARVPEAPYPSTSYAPRPTVLEPQGYYVQEGPELFGSTYERRVGGSTWHWLGTAIRLIPSDFEMKSRYGVGVDWPISYADLEPWYVRAEREIGVSGADDPALGAPRSAPYPMPPIPQSYLDGRLSVAAQSIGLDVTATPQARNSQAFDGRPACCGNATCVPICPIGAKYDATVHVGKAEKLGAQLIAPAVVYDVDVRSDGVTARFFRPDGGRDSVRAKTVILAAHAVETPKLMLMSRGSDHPAGLGNERDLVGRFLMDHPVQLSWALAPEPVYPFRGPLSTSGIEMLRDGAFRARRSAFRVEIGNDGWSWPAGDATVQAYAQATDHRLGAAGLAELKDRFARQLRLASLTEPLPDPRNRVTLAEERDSLGIPRPKLNYRTGDYARGGLSEARETHQRLFDRLGASDVSHAEEPFGAGHIMGTCRMGGDPRTSVVDAQLRVHGRRNCFVIGTAVFPTVGTANPTLTLAALSLRAADAVRESLRSGGS